jgi:hypothetical protein
MSWSYHSRLIMPNPETPGTFEWCQPYIFPLDLCGIVKKYKSACDLSKVQNFNALIQYMPMGQKSDIGLDLLLSGGLLKSDKNSNTNNSRKQLPSYKTGGGFQIFKAM